MAKANTPQNTMLTTDKPESSTRELVWLVFLMIITYPFYYLIRSLRYLTQDISDSNKRHFILAGLMAVSIFVLFIALGVIVAEISRISDITDYASLVAAPYNMDGRPVAAQGGTYGLLPIEVDKFVRDSAFEIREEILTRLDTPINASILALYTASQSEQVKVTVAEVGSEDRAVSALRALRNYADAEGSLGNFSIGLSNVSYLYYRIQHLNTLAWTHGAWIYIVSSDSMADVNDFVEHFPY